MPPPPPSRPSAPQVFRPAQQTAPAPPVYRPVMQRMPAPAGMPGTTARTVGAFPVYRPAPATIHRMAVPASLPHLAQTRTEQLQPGICLAKTQTAVPRPAGAQILPGAPPVYAPFAPNTVLRSATGAPASAPPVYRSATQTLAQAKLAPP